MTGAGPGPFGGPADGQVRLPADDDPALAAIYAALPRKRTAAGLLFVDRDERVLVVEPTYKDVWEIPGGVVEAEESPRAAAGRELREELGLDRPVGPLLCVDWNPPHPVKGDSVAFVFDGGLLTERDTAAIVLQASELRSWRFVEPGDLGGLTSARMARRLAACRSARRVGHVVYLEDGRPPGR